MSLPFLKLFDISRCPGRVEKHLGIESKASWIPFGQGATAPNGNTSGCRHDLQISTRPAELFNIVKR